MLSALFLSMTVPTYAQDYVFILKWGSYGTGDGQFDFPSGIATDSSGNVYVVDTWNHRVQKFDGSGAFITKWGSHGFGPGEFHYPVGIAIDTLGNVYVMNTYANRVQKYTSSGAFITDWGSYGSGDGRFNYSRCIAVDTSANVYVADTDNHRVQKFNTYGSFITKWGSFGSGDGQFNSPMGIAVDASGNVYVADYLNHRVQKFTGSGLFITKWGGPGSGDGQFYWPCGVAVDSYESVYVAEQGNDRVQKFSSSGVFATKWGSSGSGDGQFSQPFGVTVDASGNVYVTDVYNNRVQKFVRKTTHTLTITATAGGTTSPAPGSYLWSTGDVASVTAIPNTGWAFDHWELDGNNIGATNPISITMYQDHSLRAVFYPFEYYTLTITATVGGTTDPAPGSYTYATGTVVNVTAIPDAGYYFDHWDLDGVNVGATNSISVTMNQDHSLHAVFESSNVRGFWHFDEGTGNIAYDSSGYGNHGTIYGASWTTGKVGSALSFRGGTMDDRVQVPDSDSLDLTDSLTLEAWVKPDINIPSNHPYSYGIICKWRGSSTDPQWRTGYVLTIGAFKEHGTPSYLWLLLGFGSGTFAAWHSTKDSWNAGEWYHIMATYDKNLPSGNVKLYINGVLEGQYDEHRSIATNTLPLFIPIDPFEMWHPNNRYFPGVIDEVKIGVTPIAEYTLTITATAGGTTNPSPGSYTYAAGTIVSVTATPIYTGTPFEYWLLDGSFVYQNPISVTMDQDHSLRAIFSPVPPGVPEFPGADISIVAVTFAFMTAFYLNLKRKKQLRSTASVTQLSKT